DQICVAAGARRRGVGRALLSAARDWMIARGATRLEASIHAANDPSRALFAAAGFAPTIIRVAAAI
ncbi:MAG: GNAT family N-acetyltransferase, partial [Pseudomonadota bacterium]